MPWTALEDHPIALLSNWIKDNWPNTDPFVPKKDEIAWNSWYTGLAAYAFSIEEIDTSQAPANLGWTLRDYITDCRIHIFAVYMGDLSVDVYPTSIKNCVEWLDQFLSQNPKGLESKLIHAVRPDMGRRIFHDPDPQQDLWHLIFTVKLIYEKTI